MAKKPKQKNTIFIFIDKTDTSRARYVYVYDGLYYCQKRISVDEHVFSISSILNVFFFFI